MASVLTAIAPTLFGAAQEVSAEPAGVLDAINATFDNKGVAKGDTIKVPYAPVQSNTGFSPAAVTTEGTSVTAAAVSVTISKSQKNSMVLTGEQIRSLENGGNYQEWTRQWAAQAMRALRNEAEADAAVAIKLGASRAVGTAGTTPFAADLDLMVDVKKVLRDNGAPFADPQLVITSSAAANFQKLGIYQQAYAAGSDEERRSGQYKPQFGFKLRDSAGIALHTSGAAASYVTNGGEAAKAVSITVGTGSDTINAGDIFGLADRSGELYVVTTSITDPGELLINRPGLVGATATSQALTFTASYTPCLAFERSAVVGIMRPPLIPANATISQMLISDQFGHTYLMLDISQYGQRTWEMHLAWGFAVVQPEHVALILG